MAALFRFKPQFWTPPSFPTTPDPKIASYPYVVWNIENYGDATDIARVETYKDGKLIIASEHTIPPGGQTGFYWTSSTARPFASYYALLIRKSDGVLMERRDWRIVEGDWSTLPPRVELIAPIAPETAKFGERIKVGLSWRNTLEKWNAYFGSCWDLDTGDKLFESMWYFNPYQRRDSFYYYTMPNRNWRLRFFVMDFTPEGTRYSFKDWTILVAASTIKGLVTDAKTGLPIPATLVECDKMMVWTDELGYYSFRNLTPAVYTVSASASGYKKESKTVDASVPNTYTVDFTLEKELLPPEARNRILLALGAGSIILIGTLAVTRRKK